jgi:hypothetical protein
MHVRVGSAPRVRRCSPFRLDDVEYLVAECTPLVRRAGKVPLCLPLIDGHIALAWRPPAAECFEVTNIFWSARRKQTLDLRVNEYTP